MARPPKNYEAVAVRRVSAFQTIEQARSIPPIIPDSIIHMKEFCRFHDDYDLLEELDTAIAQYRACAETDVFPAMHMKKPERERRMERVKNEFEDHTDHWTADEVHAHQTGDYSVKDRAKGKCQNLLTRLLFQLYLDGSGRNDRYDVDGFLYLVQVVRNAAGLSSNEEAAIQQIKRYFKEK